MTGFDRVLRNQAFQKYFGMNLAFRTANAVANIAILWVVFAMTRSTINVTIVGVAESVTTVGVTLPAGVWIDRHDRRKLLLASNAICAASLGLLAVVTASYGFYLLVVIAVVIAWSAAAELYRSTNSSVLPDLVAHEELANANGVAQAGSSLLGSASNALGGALVALAGATLTFAYSALGFGAAAAFSALILYSHTTTMQSQLRRAMLPELREGFRWLVSQRGLFLLSLSAVAFNFFFGVVFYFLVIYVGVALNAGSFLFGEVLAAYILGFAIGPLLVGRTRAVAHAGKVWILCDGVALGLLVFILGIVPIRLIVIVVNFAIGLAISFANNVWLTSAQNLVPPHMRGRYFAVDGLISFIGGTTSIVAGGVLITAIGILPVYELMGVLFLVFAAGFAFAKSLWALDGSPVQASA
jgi:DHA3 family macrolide efflux protein-like MFS transporter